MTGFFVQLPVQAMATEDKTVGEVEARLSSTLQLKDLLTYAYASNPAITASRASWNAFIENYRLEKSYPDPQVMIGYFPQPIETKLGSQDWNITLSQTIPFPGRLSQKGKVLKTQADISKLKLDRKVRDIITAVSRSYYELVYIQKAIEIAESNLAINQKLSAISENAYAKDKAQFYDVSKAQSQTAQIHYDILLLKEQEQTEKTTLNTILNRAPDAPLGKAVPLPARTVIYSLDQVYKLAARNQEDILIADLNVKKAKEGVRLAHYQNLPTFKLGLFYAGIGEPDSGTRPANAGDDALGVQFGFSLPIWFGKNMSRTSKARALKIQAQAEELSTINATRAKISRLWFKLENSKRLITLYQHDLLPQAMGSLSTAQTWVSQGQESLSDFLEVQSTAYNFQLSLARAQADYAENLALLEQMAGVILDRKHISPQKGEIDK
jgi:outer membrane protein TolC